MTVYKAMLHAYSNAARLQKCFMHGSHMYMVCTKVVGSQCLHSSWHVPWLHFSCAELTSVWCRPTVTVELAVTVWHTVWDDTGCCTDSSKCSRSDSVNQ